MAGGNSVIFHDRQGDHYRLSDYAPENKEALILMYDEFSPKAVTQGLPPAGERARRVWVEGILADGINFLAWLDDAVVGHSALIPEPGHASVEYLIFVNAPWRNRGLGTALTRMAIDRAAQLGMKNVWLTVEALNFKAIKLYRKIGFSFVDTGERERTMILPLQHWCSE
jgi:ribosomal protein S18 acetylase RimI-like enzyme